MSAMEWEVKQLTFGTDERRFHSHSYYDIPVFDGAGCRIVAYQTRFAGRPITPDDRVTIGIVDAEEGGWRAVGESSAWSWQQGPMAQWVPASDQLVWNDRDGDTVVARLLDPETGDWTTLPRPVYALAPDGGFALSLNMARLDSVRPGYGYVGARGAVLHQRAPADDGVWRLDLQSGNSSLILPLKDAVRFLRRNLPLRARLRHLRHRYVYWFNHAKISPDGRRLTVKLRFRLPGGPWNDQMGVALTCSTEGHDLRLLAGGTSHVIWRDPSSLYLWQRDRVRLFADTAPAGTPLGEIAPGIIDANVHIRHFPDTPHLYVFDTPYRETVDLMTYDSEQGSTGHMARFLNHVPKRGQFRCDLHPVPSPDGRKIVVTSMHDGGRQVYVLTRRRGP